MWGESELLQAPPVSLLRMDPIRALGLTGFRAALHSQLVFLLPLGCCGVLSQFLCVV